MSPQGRFTLQLATMAVTVVLDIAVGNFSHQPTLVMAGTFVSNFQTAAATGVLIFGALMLTLVMKSEFLLPAGIVVGCVVNAWQVRLPSLVHDPSGGFRSQVAESLSKLNELLFRMSPLDLPPGCLIPLAVGMRHAASSPRALARSVGIWLSSYRQERPRSAQGGMKQ